MNGTRPIIGLTVWSCMLLSAPLLAAMPLEGGPPGTGVYFGQWRYVFSHAQPFPLNASGDTGDLSWFLDHRLRLGTEQVVTDSLAFVGELQLFFGQIEGTFDHVGAGLRPDARETLRGWDFKNAEVRELFVDYRAPWFLLRAGQVKSHWGLGLLANNGDPVPDRFGYADQGDLSERVLLMTRPLATLAPGSWLERLAVVLGGGVVYRDENAELREGDVAVEALVSTVYRDPGFEAGFYLLGRFQQDGADGATSRLDVAVVDGFAGLVPPEGKTGPVLQAELAFIGGRTDRVIDADHLSGLKVASFGAVARGGWQFAHWKLKPVLEFGYASGDSNAHDDTLATFSFDPDFHVGLVLFDSVLRSVSAMEAQEAADPDRVGLPAPGVELLPTAGRVSSAVYLFPTLQCEPVERLRILAGFLWAWRTVDFAQSYQTFLNGGVAANPYGVTSPARELGAEIDLGADYRQPIWGQLNLVAGLQAGWFFPGPAFERPDGSRPGTVNRLMARAALEW